MGRQRRELGDVAGERMEEAVDVVNGLVVLKEREPGANLAPGSRLRKRV